MRSVLLAELRHNGRRALASGLAVAICVAFVAVVLGLTSTMRTFVTDAAGLRARGADVVVTPDPAAGAQASQPSLTDAAARRLAALPGVEQASVLYTGGAQVRWPDATSFARVESLPDSPSFAWFDLLRGRLPSADREVLLDEQTARRAGLVVGDRLSLTPSTAGDPDPRPDVGLSVVGILREAGPALSSQRQVFGRSEAVQAWVGTSPSAVLLRAEAGTSVDALMRLARRGAPAEASVLTAENWAQREAAELTRGVDVLGMLVLAFTGVALVVALIVVANTLTILLAQRTERLALCRCLGATRRQLRRAVLGESLVLAAIASAAGTVVGLLIVAGCTLAVAATVDAARGARVVLPWQAWIVPPLVGIVLTVSAGMVPTWRATRVAPLAALRPLAALEQRRVGRVRITIGVLGGLAGTLAIGVAALSSASAREPALLMGVLGGSMLVLSVVVLGPVVVPLVVRPLARAAGDGSGGVVRQLAVGNVLRTPARAAATSTAVFVGVALITVMSVGAATTRSALEDELLRGNPIDVLLDFSQVEDAAAVARLVAAAGALPGTAASAVLRGGEVSAATGDLGVQGVDQEAFAAVNRSASLLRPGTMLVPAGTGSWMAAEQGRARLRGPGGWLDVEVVEGASPSMLLVEPDLERLLGGRAVTQMLLLRARDDVAAADYVDAVSRLIEPSLADSVYVMGPLVDRAAMEKVLSVLLWIATGLLAVAVVISVVGVGNTLSLAVLERRVECGLQRALGMTRRQVRRMLAAEAALLAASGVVLGLLFGIVLGWAGARVLLAGVAEVGPPTVPVLRLAGVAVLAVAAALLASVIPASRAAKVPATQALAAL